eukprot:TRINITY_DN7123_c1_g1_i2.p1 TRINITY_DN7123_c1_g1~~TRINITY_DN7123_c1_g1_i2.p1  ORF type:complete len:1235 (+),score=232.63 TRINITY_DN7123_c1_g1_i2:68-3706(+)
MGPAEAAESTPAEHPAAAAAAPGSGRRQRSRKRRRSRRSGPAGRTAGGAPRSSPVSPTPTGTVSGRAPRAAPDRAPPADPEAPAAGGAPSPEAGEPPEAAVTAEGVAETPPLGAAPAPAPDAPPLPVAPEAPPVPIAPPVAPAPAAALPPLFGYAPKPPMVAVLPRPAAVLCAALLLAGWIAGPVLLRVRIDAAPADVWRACCASPDCVSAGLALSGAGGRCACTTVPGLQWTLPPPQTCSAHACPPGRPPHRAPEQITCPGGCSDAICCQGDDDAEPDPPEEAPAAPPSAAPSAPSSAAPSGAPAAPPCPGCGAIPGGAEGRSVVPEVLAGSFTGAAALLFGAASVPSPFAVRSNRCVIGAVCAAVAAAVTGALAAEAALPADVQRERHGDCASAAAADGRRGTAAATADSAWRAVHLFTPAALGGAAVLVALWRLLVRRGSGPLRRPAVPPPREAAPEGATLPDAPAAVDVARGGVVFRELPPEAPKPQPGPAADPALALPAAAALCACAGAVAAVGGRMHRRWLPPQLAHLSRPPRLHKATRERITAIAAAASRRRGEERPWSAQTPRPGAFFDSLSFEQAAGRLAAAAGACAVACCALPPGGELYPPLPAGATAAAARKLDRPPALQLPRLTAPRVIDDILKAVASLRAVAARPAPPPAAAQSGSASPLVPLPVRRCADTPSEEEPPPGSLIRSPGLTSMHRLETCPQSGALHPTQPPALSRPAAAGYGPPLGPPPPPPPPPPAPPLDPPPPEPRRRHQRGSAADGARASAPAAPIPAQEPPQVGFAGPRPRKYSRAPPQDRRGADAEAARAAAAAAVCSAAAAAAWPRPPPAPPPAHLSLFEDAAGPAAAQQQQQGVLSHEAPPQPPKCDSPTARGRRRHVRGRRQQLLRSSAHRWMRPLRLPRRAARSPAGVAATAEDAALRDTVEQASIDLMLRAADTSHIGRQDRPLGGDFVLPPPPPDAAPGEFRELDIAGFATHVMSERGLGLRDAGPAALCALHIIESARSHGVHVTPDCGHRLFAAALAEGYAACAKARRATEEDPNVLPDPQPRHIGSTASSSATSGDGSRRLWPQMGSMPHEDLEDLAAMVLLPDAAALEPLRCQLRELICRAPDRPVRVSGAELRLFVGGVAGGVELPWHMRGEASKDRAMGISMQSDGNIAIARWRDGILDVSRSVCPTALESMTVSRSFQLPGCWLEDVPQGPAG